MTTDAARGPRFGQKLSCEERRTAILRAVRRVFAEKGFDGTTTRELADAAGVSEALLFKHFPNKEALFSAMKVSLNEQDLGRLERIKELEPSVSTLVLLVHFLTHLLIEGWTTAEDEPAIQTRLMLRSLAQDGEFARLLLRRVATEWVPKIDECLRCSRGRGGCGGHAGLSPSCRLADATRRVHGDDRPLAGEARRGLRNVAQETGRTRRLVCPARYGSQRRSHPQVTTIRVLLN